MRFREALLTSLYGGHQTDKINPNSSNSIGLGSRVSENLEFEGEGLEYTCISSYNAVTCLYNQMSLK